MSTRVRAGWRVVDLSSRPPDLFNDWRSARDWLVGELRERRQLNDANARKHTRTCDHYPCLYLRELMKVMRELEEATFDLQALRENDSWEREITGVKYWLTVESIE